MDDMRYHDNDVYNKSAKMIPDLIINLLKRLFAWIPKLIIVSNLNFLLGYIDHEVLF